MSDSSGPQPQKKQHKEGELQEEGLVPRARKEGCSSSSSEDDSASGEG